MPADVDKHQRSQQEYAAEDDIHGDQRAAVVIHIVFRTPKPSACIYYHIMLVRGVKAGARVGKNTRQMRVLRQIIAACLVYLVDKILGLDTVDAS